MRTVLVCIAFVWPSFCLAQKLELTFNGKSDTLESGRTTKLTVTEPIANHQAIFLNFRVTDRQEPSILHYKFQDIGGGTASQGKDYRYQHDALNEKIIDSNASISFTIGIEIMSDEIPEVDEFFNLTIIENNAGIISTYPIEIVIKDPKNPLKGRPDTPRWELRVITGSNFDFFEAPTFKNFAGDINLFAPNVWKSVKIFGQELSSIGFQFGIYNFNYFEADSSKGRLHTEQYLTSSAITQLMPNETRYIRETYALDVRTDFSIWGWYLNPMTTIDESGWASIYLNMHFEGMARTTTTKPNKVGVRMDTLTVTQADIDQSKVFPNSPAFRAEYSKHTSYETYLGFGMPLRTNTKGKFDFFVNPTIGVAMFDHRVVRDQTINGIEQRILSIKPATKPFFLLKGQLITDLAPVDLALGWEYRAVANYARYWAMYFGAIIPLDKLKK